nr:HEAT repeat domain-containing protein [Actinomycetota bacterium]
VLVREAAVAALGSLGDERGLEAVLAGCHDIATIRRRAVLALAAFDGPAVEAMLRDLSTDRDRQVRQAAEDLLQGWGSYDDHDDPDDPDDPDGDEADGA